MEKLLETAQKAVDQVEIYSIQSTANKVSFKDAKLYNIETDYQSGVSLRIIKNGKLGFAYTRNLTDRQELLNNALLSLEGGVEAGFDFPGPAELHNLDTYDPSIKTMTCREALEETKRICENLSGKTAGEIMAGAFFAEDTIRIMNSNGVDMNRCSSIAGSHGEIIYPGSGSGIGREYLGKKLESLPKQLIDEIAFLYSKGEKVVEPKGGRMKVLFMPESMITLLWRISSGLSGKSVYDKISPISDKIGQNIFSSSLTILDNPLNDKFSDARAWDDEGVPCRELTLVENGILKSFYYNLKYAGKAGAKSTGHGYRNGPWGGDPLTINPGPFLGHLTIKPGNSSLEKLISSMDRGVIVEGVLGAHSGNIPNGDYSVGISPGLYVENGEIVGRVKDAMIAGNIYETLSSVADIGSVLYPAFSGALVPPILCEGVSVTTKK
jgi:PmbA protein